MSDGAESVVRQFLGALERANLDEVLGFVNDDAVFEDPRGAQRGLAAIREGFGAELAMTPKFKSEIKNLVAHGGTVMVERVDSFEIANTRLRMQVVGVFNIDAAGTITRWREYFDQKTLEETLGAAGSTMPS